MELQQHRHGQMALFIIVVLVMVLLMVGLFMRMNMTSDRMAGFVKTSEQWDVEGIRVLMQSCLEKVAVDSLFYFGMVGGRVDYFTSYFVYDTNYTIPYYYKNGALIPSKGEVESGILEPYVNSRVVSCVDGFRSVKGFEIQEGEVQSDITINERAVDFALAYPVEVIRGDQKTILKDFSFSIPSRLYEILWIASEVVNRELVDDRFIHWDFMADVTRRGYNMTAHAERDNTVIYRIVDPEFPLYFEPFVFQFANEVTVA